MEINNNTIINVLNYMPITITASTNVEDYVFEPCETDTPIIKPMTAVEVKEIHSKSRIFTDGWLTFEDDVKNDMYKFLKIKDGENILTQSEIMGCIISGSKNDVQKLINIKSKGYYERVYGVYVALKQSNRYDISMRVAKAIEHRYKELQQGIINTQIELTDALQNDDDKDKLIAEKDALLVENQSKIDALEKQIEQLMKSMAQIQNINSVDETENTQKTDSTPNKRGRKPTAK